MKKLLSILEKNIPSSIVVHNNPDPDSLASAMALRHLLKINGYKRVKIFYDGLIGRAENQALIKILKIPLSRTQNMKTGKKRQFILVDCQPGTGNVTLPEDAVPAAVIDHHPPSRKSPEIPFRDIRPGYGASSTIIFEYYGVTGAEVPMDIATALFHAISSETQSLGREGSREDKEAFLKLLPQISFSQLYKIQFPPISKEFVVHLSEALINTFYYKNLIGVVLDQLPYTDFVAEIADFLLRVKNITWSLCIGSYGDNIYISLRTSNIEANASKMMKKIIPRYGTAGGHDMVAGAQVSMDQKMKKNPGWIKKEIVGRMLKELNLHPAKNVFRLVTNEEYPL